MPTIKMGCATEGAEIRYTIDGTTPNAGSMLYTEPIQVEDVVIKARGFKEGMLSSQVAEYDATEEEEELTMIETSFQLTNGKLPSDTMISNDTLLNYFKNVINTKNYKALIGIMMINPYSENEYLISDKAYVTEQEASQDNMTIKTINIILIDKQSYAKDDYDAGTDWKQSNSWMLGIQYDYVNMNGEITEAVSLYHRNPDEGLHGDINADFGSTNNNLMKVIFNI